jgi:hypothetical protein
MKRTTSSRPELKRKAKAAIERRKFYRKKEDEK